MRAGDGVEAADGVSHGRYDLTVATWISNPKFGPIESSAWARSRDPLRSLMDLFGNPSPPQKRPIYLVVCWRSGDGLAPSEFT